jgi:hypothetical protein
MNMEDNWREVNTKGSLRKLLVLLVCLVLFPISVLPSMAAATGSEEVLAEANPVCAINGVAYESFSEALTSATNGDTITLLCSFTHYEAIVLDGKSITIATNGYVMNVDPQNGSAFHVRTATLSLDDSAGGALNATCTNDWSYGAIVSDWNSHITLSNVSSARGITVQAGSITVKGSVICTPSASQYSAVTVRYGGVARISGDVISAGYGLDIHYYNSAVYVGGDVIAQEFWAIRISCIIATLLSDDLPFEHMKSGEAIELSEQYTKEQTPILAQVDALVYPSVEVSGNVICTSSNLGTYAIYSESNTNVFVLGDVISVGGQAVVNNGDGHFIIGGNCTGNTAGIQNWGGSVVVHGDVTGNHAITSGTINGAVSVLGNVYGNEMGVSVSYGGTVSITGRIIVSNNGTYILIDSLIRNPVEYEPYSQQTGYRQYANNSATGYVSLVWVKIPTTGAPKSGDLNGDGVVTLDEAMRVTRVVAGVGMTLNAQEFAAVDMDGDGSITMTDVMLIVRKACGL